MEITSKNIANRTFTVTHRGYDRKEVQDFLAEVAHEISMQQIRNGDFNRSSNPSNAVVDSVMGQPASSDPEVADAFRDAARIRAEADAYYDMRKRAADALMEEARSQAAAGLASMPADLKKPDAPTSRPISSVKFDELSNAEREIVSRLSVTSKDLQRSYGGPKSPLATSVSPPAASAPSVSPPAASAPPSAPPSAPSVSPPAASAAQTQPAAPEQPKADAAAAGEPPVIDVGDELEVVKNASSLLDGVLDDVMESLRGDSS